MTHSISTNSFNEDKRYQLLTFYYCPFIEREKECDFRHGAALRGPVLTGLTISICHTLMEDKPLRHKGYITLSLHWHKRVIINSHNSYCK